jgi:hypothetical protein
MLISLSCGENSRQFWSMRVNRQKGAVASIIRSCHMPDGLRLATRTTRYAAVKTDKVVCITSLRLTAISCFAAPSFGRWPGYVVPTTVIGYQRSIMSAESS